MNMTPKPGDRVKHVKTNGLYRIVCLGKIEASLALAVVYQSENDGQMWIRPLKEFMDGRFERVDTIEALGAEGDAAEK